MLTQTSETAVRALILISLAKEDRPLTPRQIAHTLGTSPTYMAKITGLLVKTNILRSQRGATGGVLLARDPQTITLLAIVEACQGLLLGNYCEEISDHPDPVCAFHEAMKEAHSSLINVLSKWTLEDMKNRPGPEDPEREAFCKMGFSCEAAAKGCAIVQPGKDQGQGNKTKKNT